MDSGETSSLLFLTVVFSSSLDSDCQLILIEVSVASKTATAVAAAVVLLRDTVWKEDASDDMMKWVSLATGRRN
jgi:hypothetical protein